MSIAQAIEALRLEPRFMRCVTAWRRLPRRPGRYAPLPDSLDVRLRRMLEARGIRQLYQHQAMALSAIAQGQHVVIVTSTASGKTLCYNLPVLSLLLQDPDACALYLFPTKALAHDQLAELASSLEALGLPSAWASTYDGDTPQAHRPVVRRMARLVLSNPDMLHVGILPSHTRWERFFVNLRYVVLDELHTYRGVFGSHMANVLRRLRRICRFYGSDPQFICTSATIANPAELATRLIEAPVTLIDQDGSPRGEKHFIIYNPPVVNAELGLRRSPVLEAQRIATHLLEHGVQTIVFARARLTTEVLLTYLRDAARQVGVPPEAVRGYRGGYLPVQRREIERGLREGAVRAVVATNALELGIDIGHLSAAVLTGYPGTIASTWQQAGRAGRRHDVSLAILIAGGDVLDQYIAAHPEYLFERDPEQALIHPDNLVILLNHVRCAAFELPFRRGEPFGSIEDVTPLLEYLADEGVLYSGSESWHWISQAYPAETVSLRTASPDRFVILKVDEEGPAQPIGELDRFSVPMLLHEGAIYLHEGQSYIVERLDWERSQAWVRAAEVDYYTQASITESVHIRETYDEGQQGNALRAHGEVSVIARATRYRRIRRYTLETLGWGEIDLPEQEIETTAFWLSFPEEALEELRESRLWLGDPLDYGPNWEAQRQRARERDGFRCAQCGAPERDGREHDVHHIRPLRAFILEAQRREQDISQVYLEANRLENLITLCPACHRRAENHVRTRTGLSGLAHVLSHVASIHLMCDPRDLGVVTEARSPNTGCPTITLYERVLGGVGLAQRLFEITPTLLEDCSDVIERCGCTVGCPACIGPVLDETPLADPKGLAQALIKVALGEPLSVNV
ncbi:MAG TPA: DEAD/DEAH box helicase [Caldilineae bacterium]|nr:DEAD/DEAH box helicase [Caldilineae bacterium]